MEEFRSGAAIEERPTNVAPSAIDAEVALLGALMRGSVEALAAMQDVLRPEDFYRPAHRLLYDALVALAAVGEPMDPVFALRRLTESGMLQSSNLSGGALVEMVEQAAVAGTEAHYARMVAEAARRRSLIDVGSRLMKAGYSGEGTAAEIASAAGADLFSVASPPGSRQAGSAASAVASALDQVEAIQAGEAATGIPTGLVDVDVMLWGLARGALILVAARPSVGKSALVGLIARNVAVLTGMPVLFASLEMSEQELGMRWLCSESAVPWTKIRAGRASEAEWSKMARASEVLHAMPVAIVTGQSTPADIRNRARQMRARGGLGLIVVDYLQLMTTGRRVESRTAEVAEISRSLKLLALELEVPILACSQMNRAMDAREVRRPQLSDLRESGSLEQDADVVMFLHRPDDRAYVEAIVAKHRNGPIGSVPLRFVPEITRFESWPAAGPGKGAQ